MRVPDFERYRGWMAGIGLFLAGAIVGAAVFMSLYQHAFSILAIQNNNLLNELEKLKVDLKTQIGTKQKQAYIGLIKVYIESSEAQPLDDLTLGELRKRVHKDLLVASGKPVSAVTAAPKVFIKLVDGNIYHSIRDKDYTVHVETFALVQSELTVWLTADEYLKN